jgi:hypothetical protein
MYAAVTNLGGNAINCHDSYVREYAIAKAIAQAYDIWRWSAYEQKDGKRMGKFGPLPTYRPRVEVHESPESCKAYGYPDSVIEFQGPDWPPDHFPVRYEQAHYRIQDFPGFQP